MGSYVPSTPAQRQEMLEAIGLHDFRQLYRDVPEEMLLRDGLDLPEGMSELEVAVVVPHQLGLALYHGDGPLMTGLGAGAAAVAFLPVDFNDPSFHDHASLFF